MKLEPFVPRSQAKSFGFLFDEVIKRGRCTKCGGCVASCPYKVLTIDNMAELPILVGECVSCQICCFQCPRVDFPTPEIEKLVFGRIIESGGKLGFYTSIRTGRSRKKEILERCEDGGVVSSLVAYALDSGTADSAILASTHEFLPWKSRPVVATTHDEVVNNAGSKYSISPTMLGLRQAVDDHKARVVLVGLPCQIQTLRRMQTTKLKVSKLVNPVILAISLFCMESYLYDRFLHALFTQNGIDPAAVTKFSIKRGRFRIFVNNEEKMALPLKDIRPLMNSGCTVCSDYAGEYADISVGTIGSQIGWSTILCRTEKGEKILREALEAGYLEIKPLMEEGPEFDLLLREADRKKQRAAKNLA